MRSQADPNLNGGIFSFLLERERREPGMLTKWAKYAVDKGLSPGTVFKLAVLPQLSEQPYIRRAARLVFNLLFREAVQRHNEEIKLEIERIEETMERDRREFHLMFRAITRRAVSQCSSAACNQGRTRRRPTHRRTTSSARSSRGSPGPGEPPLQPKRPRYISLADCLESHPREAGAATQSTSLPFLEAWSLEEAATRYYGSGSFGPALKGGGRDEDEPPIG